MPWKKDGEQIVVQDGHPVWVYDDGKESPFDAGSALDRIKTVTAESVSRKEKIRDMESKLEVIDGIDNPAEFVKSAKKALETVKNLDDKKLMDAGEVEALKKSVADSYESKLSETKKAYETQIEKLNKNLDGNAANLRKLLIENALKNSVFIKEKTKILPSFAYDSFGKNFSVEEIDGELMAVGVRANGEKIYSLKNAGSYANCEEAIEILINERTDKDQILLGIDGGGGAQNQGGHKRNGPDLMKLNPTERLNAARGIKN